MGMKDIMRNTLAAVLAVGMCMSATGGLQPVHAEEQKIVYTNDDRAAITGIHYNDFFYEYYGGCKEYYGENNDCFYYYIDGDSLSVVYWVSNGQDTISIPDTMDGQKIISVTIERDAGFKHVILGDGIEELHFSNSSHMPVETIETITVGKSYSHVDWNGCCVDRGFESLKKVIISKENTNLKSVNGVVFSKNGKELLFYPSQKKQRRYVVPDGTKEIARDAFRKSPNLKEVVIPSSVKKIGYKAFYDCDNLRKYILKGKKTGLTLDSGFLHLDNSKCNGYGKIPKNVIVKAPAGSVVKKLKKNKKIKFVTTGR